MSGLFCESRKVKNNEEYRLLLKKRQKRMWGLFTVGALTTALGAALSILEKEQISSRQTYFILGLGTGLALASVMEIWILRRKMGSEERLKKERLKEMDEREIEVRSRALQATAKLLLVVIYLLALIGGLFMEELVRVCLLLSGIFLLSYILFQRYYGMKL